MRWINRLPEKKFVVARWLLLTGWILLIISLFVPWVTSSQNIAEVCIASTIECSFHQNPGNQLFWGVVVPTSILILVVLSHEFWRRICPLAFVSQIFRIVGWQRTLVNAKGRQEPVKIRPDSWLAKHHVELQWSLLISGLCIRLLVINSSPLGLGILLISTLACAAYIGWAYSGKAWCQYFCPMAPVQTILTGQRGAFGTPAHIGNTSKITQSMCRSVSQLGKEQSACVACQSSCIDIDSERHYWQQIKGKRGLTWAWYSYPGLILVFFKIMNHTQLELHHIDTLPSFIKDNSWAYDATLASRALLPFADWLIAPRLIVIPVALLIGGYASYYFFLFSEKIIFRYYESRDFNDAFSASKSHVRLLSSFMAVNIFFWFVDPSQGMAGVHGGQLIRSVVLVASAIVLFRSWRRDPSTYRRESTSDSLRRQLQRISGLENYLDGRKIDELSSESIYTLAKALPHAIKSKSSEIYQGVITDLFKRGALNRAAALVELEELRLSLNLSDEDHHAAIRILANDEPQLLHIDKGTLELNQLREQALADSVEECLSLSGIKVLSQTNIEPHTQQKLNTLISDSGLGDSQVQKVLSRFRSTGDLAKKKIENLRRHYLQELSYFKILSMVSAKEVLLRPLALAMHQRVDQIYNQIIAVEPSLTIDEKSVEPGPLGIALEVLWQDPDPETAGWALMVQRILKRKGYDCNEFQVRSGLSTSQFLESQLKGQIHRDLNEFPYLARSPLFKDLLPADLLWVAEHGWLKSWKPNQRVDCNKLILIVLNGSAIEVLDNDYEVRHDLDSLIGAMNVISGEVSKAKIYSLDEGMKAFAFPSHAFDELLSRSSHFSRGLLRQFSSQLNQVNAN